MRNASRHRRRPARAHIKRLARRLLVESLETRALMAVVQCGLEGHTHTDGVEELHVLPMPEQGAFQQATTSTSSTNTAMGTLASLSDTFRLHSNAAAAHRIYLDFTGHTTAGTVWNSYFTGGSNIVTPAYDFDGNASAFSDPELERIQYIWQRVAEDFAPFNVDVTTEEPVLSDLTYSGSGDSRWGVRVVIGGSCYDWFGSGAGGVAYVGSFNWSSDTPAFVFTQQLGTGAEKYTAEAITHEAGHTLGLDHDGTATAGYYTGQGSGETGWAPIMGVGYYQNLTQWSKGEYSGANNKQDDLAIITTSNGFGYRADDFGNTSTTAFALVPSGNTIAVSGIIERSTDADVFSFTTGSGQVSLNFSPAVRGPNLDIYAELFDSSNGLIASSNPSASLGASITTTLASGQYFIRVRGTGSGDPLTTGYTNYASLGQYSITGTIVADGSTNTTNNNTNNNNTNSDTLGIVGTNASRYEANSGKTSYTFTVTRGGNTALTTTVNWSVTGSGTSAATASDFVGGILPSGTLTFLAGEVSKVITVLVVGEKIYESDEQFTVTLSNASGSTQILDGGAAVGTIRNDDAPPPPVLSISAVDANKSEGTSTTTTFTFRLDRTGDLTRASSVKVAVATKNGSGWVNRADFVGGALPFSTVNMAAGVSSALVMINVVGDATAELDEQFSVKLSNVSGATLGVATASGTIVNDDAAAIRSVISRRSAIIDNTFEDTFDDTFDDSDENNFESSLSDLAQSTFTWQDAASRAPFGLPSATVSVETRGGLLSPRACDALLSDYTMLPASAIDLADLDSLAPTCSTRARCRANDSALVDFDFDAFAANRFACESQLAMK